MNQNRRPTDYPTRAAAYRRHAKQLRTDGEHARANECEDFARRCDARATLFTPKPPTVAGAQCT